MANACEIYNCDVVDFDENEDDDLLIDDLFEAYRQQSSDYLISDPRLSLPRATSQTAGTATTPLPPESCHSTETPIRKRRGRPPRQLSDYLISKSPIPPATPEDLDRRHVCDVCGKRFKMKIHLTDHKLIHSGEKPHKCPVCGRGFRQKSQLNGHMIRHSGAKSKYACTLCDATFRLKKEHDEHVRVHAQPKPPRPAAKTARKDAGDTEGEFEEEITVFGIEMSPEDKHTRNSPRLEAINTLRPGTGVPKQEPPCDQEASESPSSASMEKPELKPLDTHQIISIKEEKLSPTATQGMSQNIDESRPYQCEFCFKKFRLRNHLSEHRLIHLNLKPHSCPKCLKSFRQKSHLTSHLMKICGKQTNTNYTCTHCPKTFRFKTALDIHMAGHFSADQTLSDNAESTERSENVQVKKENQLDNSSGFYSEADATNTQEYLETSVETSDELTESMKVDIRMEVTPWSTTKSGTRRYKCDTCHKCFRNYTHLRDHLLVHAGIKPHKCKLCLKTFRQKSSLKCHMKNLHMEKKMYECDTCGASYHVKAHFTRHQNKCRDSTAWRDGPPNGNHDLRQMLKADNSGNKPPRNEPSRRRQSTASLDESKNEESNTQDGIQSVLYSDYDDGPEFESDGECSPNEETNCGDASDKSRKKRRKSYNTATDIDLEPESFTLRGFQDGDASCDVRDDIVDEEHSLGTGDDKTMGENPNSIKKKSSLRQRRKPRRSYAEASNSEISDTEIAESESTGPDWNPKSTASVKKIKCKICDMKFRNRRQLNDHVVSEHTNSRAYSCEECSTACTTLEALEDHVSDKHPDTKYDCPHCKQQFKSSWSLNKHVCPEGKFPCSVCNEAFATRSQLANHSISHTEGEHFTCLLCDKRFLSDNGLRVHITTVHAGSADHSCDICEKNFASAALLNLHIKRAHTAKPPLSCNYCHKTFKFRYALNVHQKYHTNERNYQCPHCEKRFVKSSDVNAHILTHAARRFACEFCGSMFRTNGSLRTHIKTRHPADPDKYKCDVCGATFGRECLLQSHSRIHDSNRERYSCPYCEKKFTDKYYVKQHMRYHTNERNFICHECGKAFVRKCDLTAHLPIHSDARPFVCTDCGKSFKKEMCLRAHAVIHNPDKHFKCPVCDETFPSKSKLKSHSYKHTGEEKPKYNCELCTKTFVSKSYVKLHMLRHKNVREFGCNECGMYFVRKCDLYSHMKKHSKLRPYACEYCGNTYRSKYTLAEHQSTHSGELPFSCDICGKKFRKEEYLRLHSAIHTGDKPYMCEVCSKSFARSSSLIKHRVIHDDVKPHNCHICGKGFTQKQLYDVHMKIHAGIKDHICRICGHAFAAKSGLRNHYQYVHSNHKPHKCEFCDKCFAFKTDRRKHMKVHQKDDMRLPLHTPLPQNLTIKSHDSRDDISRDFIGQNPEILNEPGSDYINTDDKTGVREFPPVREQFHRAFPEVTMAPDFLRNVPIL